MALGAQRVLCANNKIEIHGVPSAQCSVVGLSLILGVPLPARFCSGRWDFGTNG